jgi:hypothetical protein
VPVVIVSGDSDELGDFSLLLNADSTIKQKVFAWYAINCAFPALSAERDDTDDKTSQPIKGTKNPLRPPSDEKLYCLPLGINQWGHHRWTLGNYLRSNPSPNPQDKRHLLLFSFAVASNPALRSQLWKDGCEEGGRFTSFAHCHFDRKTAPEKLYEMIRQSKFVISPPGLGPDCYRTWEVLYLRSFVVVKSSALDSLYDGLPVLIVGKWEDMTEELLKKTFERFQRMEFKWDRLDVLYWRRQIFGGRNFTYNYDLNF